VTAALRVMGLGASPHFQRDHRVLNRDHWSSLAVSRVLLGLLVTTFAASEPLGIGVDETVERRQGAKIAAKGIYRDAVRSRHSHFVKASGLRPICLMLLAPIPWADPGAVWADGPPPFSPPLPPPSGPMPLQDGSTERRPIGRGNCFWSCVAGIERAVVAVADSGYAALALPCSCTRQRAGREELTSESSKGKSAKSSGNEW